MIEDASRGIGLLLEGRIPEILDCEGVEDGEERRLAELLNQLIWFIREIHENVVPLAAGDLGRITWSRKNFLASPFKELHSRLLHLTWQAKQVASGDYSQRVDFMGEFSEAFNAMVESLDKNVQLLKAKINELETTLSLVRTMEGILPICASCKRIRIEGGDPMDQEAWIPIESYISKRTETQFSHSICPVCMKKLYPEYQA